MENPAGNSKLKVGVIGVGALGRHHARLYNLSENAEVVGIFDTTAATARAVGDEFGLKVYDTWHCNVVRNKAGKEREYSGTAMTLGNNHNLNMPYHIQDILFLSF